MSNTLPVPSKGALRALRNIALGTSCTVAVSAGLLTEDRRRRIHAARAVQQNGQRIKCSKSYHESAGATAIAALEEHVLSPEYFTSTEDRHLLPPPGTWKSQPIQTHFAHEIPTAPGRAPIAPPTIISKPSLPAPSPTAIRHDSRYHVSTQRVVEEADSLLADATLSGVLRSINYILQHLRKGGLSQNDPALVDVCGRIYERCAQESNMQAYLPLLQELLSMKSISEELYYAIHAPETGLQILDLRARQADTSRDAEYLNAATSIFYTPFESSKASKYMKDLAAALCVATFNAQMYEETVKICESFMHRFGSYFASYTKYLILAHHELGNDSRVLKHFESDFATTTWRSSERYVDFDQVGAAALDSALKQRRPRAAQRVVQIAAEKARASGFNLRAEWFNKLLAKQWSYSKDLQKTRARAERLEAFIDVLHMPEAFYCAMMQFCVEAGDGQLADQYMDKIATTDGGISPLIQVRASGHVALASAMKGDWGAVRELIKGLLSQQNSSAERDVISKIFVPLFKLYATSHDVRQTEKLLREVLEDGMPLHRYTSNIMVNKFASSRDMDSVARWLDEIPLWGLDRPDAATYNTILLGLRDEWAMPFDDLIKCAQEVKARHLTMVDTITFKILRDAAARDSKGNRLAFSRALRRIEKLGIRGKARDSPKNDEDIMREATAKGSNVVVLRQYDHAMADPNSHVSAVMLGWAIKAVLNMRDRYSHEAAIQMLEDAKQRGVDIISGATRLMLWQLDQADGSRRAVRMTMDTFTRHGFEMPKSAILHIGNMLCNRNKHKQALDAWEQYVNSSGMQQQDLDIACLTLLLRIHLVTKDPAGLENIMQTMSANHIVPDQAFMVTLNNERRKLEKYVKEAGGSSKSTMQQLDYLEVLKALCKRLKAQRAAQLAKSHAAAAQLLDIMDQAVRDDENLQQEDVKTEKSSQPASLLQCPACDEDKPRADFAEKNAYSGGLFSDCHSCRTAETEAANSTQEHKIVAPAPREDSQREDHAGTRPQISIITREGMSPEQIEAHKQQQVRKRWLDKIHQAREEVERENENENEEDDWI